MPAVLLSLLIPFIEAILKEAAVPLEGFLVTKLIAFVEEHLKAHVRLDQSWSMTAAVTDEAAGIVCVNLTRNGQEAAALVLYPLAMTASHQTAIAGLLGAFVHEGDQKLLDLFAKVVKK